MDNNEIYSIRVDYKGRSIKMKVVCKWRNFQWKSRITDTQNIMWSIWTTCVVWLYSRLQIDMLQLEIMIMNRPHEKTLPKEHIVVQWEGLGRRVQHFDSKWAVPRPQLFFWKKKGWGIFIIVRDTWWWCVITLIYAERVNTNFYRVLTMGSLHH